MEWLYLVIFAYFIWSFCSIFDKFLVNRGYVKSTSVLIVNNFFTSLLAVIALLFFIDYLPGLTDIIVAFLAGFAYIGLILPFYKALKHEEISRIVPLSQLTPLFVLAFSYLFLAEVLTTKQYIGFFLLLSGGIAISVKNSKGLIHFNKAFFLMMLSNTIAAFSILLTKIVFTNIDYIEGFFFVRLGSVLGVSLLFLNSQFRKNVSESIESMSKKIRVFITLKIIIDSIALAAFNYAFIFGSPSIISGLGTSLQPVFTLILVFLISKFFPAKLQEDITKKTLIIKIISIIIIIFGIWLIN